MSNLREVLVELAECAFRREPPFDGIDNLGIPTMAEMDFLYFDEAVAHERNMLGHELYLLSLRGETDPSLYDQILDRRRNAGKKGRRKDPPPAIFRRDEDRKGCMRVLRKTKRDLMAAGWKRLKGGRFRKEYPGFWIEFWFDPGTYVSSLSAFLAVGPPRVRLDIEKFFDVWLDPILFFGPPEEFERNLHTLLFLVNRLPKGLEEIIACCPLTDK